MKIAITIVTVLVILIIVGYTTGWFTPVIQSSGNGEREGVSSLEGMPSNGSTLAPTATSTPQPSVSTSQTVPPSDKESPSSILVPSNEPPLTTTSPSVSQTPLPADEVKFDFVMKGITGAGLSRTVTALLTNTGNTDAHNVWGQLEGFSGGGSIKLNGEDFLRIDGGIDCVQRLNQGL